MPLVRFNNACNIAGRIYEKGSEHEIEPHLVQLLGNAVEVIDAAKDEQIRPNASHDFGADEH